MNNQTIILCATQRCGSTLVVEDMRNSGQLGNPEEWFISWDPDNSTRNWQEQLTGVLDRATDSFGTAAVKVMANQLPSIDRCLSGQSEATPQFDNFYKAFSKAIWIRLFRGNVVYQSISRIMSRQTGINHATKSLNEEHFAGNLLKGYADDYNDGTKYSFNEILKEIVAINIENLVWQDFFDRHLIKPLELQYEYVSNDKDMKHIDQMGALINRHHLQKLPRKMVKLGNQTNDEWYHRFMSDMVGCRFRGFEIK